MRSTRPLTVREIAEDRNISVGSCREILVEKLEMHRSKICPSVDVARPERQSHHPVRQELLYRVRAYRL